MPETKKYIRIATQNEQGQRIDNFLIKTLKGVPKSRIYKAVRCGEVRINGGRIKVSTKINCHDQIRVPPLRVSTQSDAANHLPGKFREIKILYEDENLLIVDKPSGVAVHGGTGLSFGLIEFFRQSRDDEYLELVHRLDRETSGCLVLAKDRPSLLGMQQQFMQLPQKKKIVKHYLALIMGQVAKKTFHIRTGLSRIVLNAEKRTVIDEQGQASDSKIKLLKQYSECALVDILLITGRTHQARVHCASVGHFIAGDKMYGNKEFNGSISFRNLSRLFLHAHQLIFIHPISGQEIQVDCALPEALQSLLDTMA